MLAKIITSCICKVPVDVIQSHVITSSGSGESFAGDAFCFGFHFRCLVPFFHINLCFLGYKAKLFHLFSLGIGFDLGKGGSSKGSVYG